MLYSS